MKDNTDRSEVFAKAFDREIDIRETRLQMIEIDYKHRTLAHKLKESLDQMRTFPDRSKAKMQAGVDTARRPRRDWPASYEIRDEAKLFHSMLVSIHFRCACGMKSG